MKRGRFTEEQIIGVLREQEAGLKTADLCRKHGISEATYCAWKAKYGGLGVGSGQSTEMIEIERIAYYATLDALTEAVGRLGR